MTIELRNVSRWYGNVVAVNDVTMTIGPGVTGLLGPNGAGKSTIMHMIAGFLPPSRGELTIDGGHSWHNPDIYRTVGLFLASLTGRRAYATGIVAISCFLTWTVSELLIQSEGGITSTSTGARIGGLFSPFNILDGIRIWLGGTSPGEDANPGRFGPLYGIVGVLLLAACLGGLAARYRKVSRA